MCIRDRFGDGSQSRTFCYVDDNIDATTKALYDDHFINDVVNVGSDVEMSIKQLALKIIEMTGSSSPIVHLPALTEGDMTRRKPDITKMKQILKRDLLSVDEGIKKMIEHIKASI